MKKFLLLFSLSLIAISAKDFDESYLDLPSIVEQTVPACVYIECEKRIEKEAGWLYWFLTDEATVTEVGKWSGAGFFISEDGYIMTNYHVIEDATKITVHMRDGSWRECEAEVIGGDKDIDIAVVKVTSEESFSYLKLGDSRTARVGDWVLVMGCPYDEQLSTTFGIVSGVERRHSEKRDGFFDLIQVDAATNSGNSGGPILNMRGEVVAVDFGRLSDSDGISFGVPSNTAYRVQEMVIDSGAVTPPQVGVLAQTITSDLAKSKKLSQNHGVLINRVDKDSPAARGGIESGDIILEFDGLPVASVGNLNAKLFVQSEGVPAMLTVDRNGELIHLEVIAYSVSS